MALMTKAPTQEEQIEYALSLRNLKTGWTMEQRKTYFTWFLKAANYKGGHSFARFRAKHQERGRGCVEPGRTRPPSSRFLTPRPKIDNPWANAKPRPFVKKWTIEDLLPAIDKGLTGRNFEQGRQLFGESHCYSCHRFNNEGGNFGPDLTILSGRFAARDVIDKVINPNKYISDQFAGVTILTTDEKVITGRIINIHGDTYQVNTNMLDPNGLTNVSRKNIASISTSKVSMMPSGLLDTLQQNEILDLMAYLLSRGDRNHKMFAR